MKPTLTRRSLVAEIAGWYGTIAVLVAYGLLSFNIIASQTLLFQLLNLTGAIGIIIVASYKRVKQVVILNIVWAALALFALVNILGLIN
jgi:uncharacterized YccA/Bax inhibitor family protein